MQRASSPSRPIAIVLALAAAAAAQGPVTTGVPNANTRATAMNRPNVLTELLLGRAVVDVARAEGSMAVENPMPTAQGAMVTHYGYLDNGPMAPVYGDVQSSGHNVEASKTEPDKNVYLRLRQSGPDAGYAYGKNFVFQGHEQGLAEAGIPRGSLTRVNLDADVAHRVTVLATADSSGTLLPVFDGITWDPFARRLLLTSELGGTGGVWMATADWPSTVVDVSGAMGRGGYEGIQCDNDGNLWIVEDVGGSTGAVNNRARQPNSFVYRFVPSNPRDLTQGGRLQVLQAASLANPGQPIVFHAGQADADILSQDVLDLHTYGNSFPTLWVTIHDTAIDGNAPFSANALAKTAGGTPFKRPENGVFRPATRFREFFFTETGDTNILTQAGSDHGGFGGLFRLQQTGASADTGTLSLFYLGDAAHSGFDNIQFLTGDLVLAAEDAGDTLHGQRNALDSLWMFDARLDYGAATAPAAVRVLAEGRDQAATTDTTLAGQPGFQNDGDNEITGIHVSDGDASIQGLLGAREPRPFQSARVFWSQQHGTNVLHEVVAIDRGDDR